MKNTFVLLFFISSLVTNSQKVHKGLLWEISGNGLQKKSYLYGTMHVSGRIAYHLGEEFFNGIESVDAIALESNPIIWLDEIVNSKYAADYLGRYAIKSQTYKGFYKEAFKIEIPQKKEIANALSSNHYLTNWMLYRGSGGKSDFEEETFLDMFIYQAGSKNNKPVYSLEKFKQTSIFSKLSQIPDIEKKEQSNWYKELTKDKRYYEILQDAYRDQDLDLLDSLQKEVSSDNHLKYMLYDRNVIMANNIDSIIKNNTSLFIGIGAAHLPKQKGVIGLLRSKGYILKPISPTTNNKAKESKEKLSKQKRSIPFNQSFKSDLFTIKLPSKIYETPSLQYQRQFFSPELTNGTFYTVTQISTYAFLNGNSKANYLSKVDSLLFENIPGKIIEKKIITKNGFKGLDIINKTKSGDFQHYQIIITPINIFIFKMGGKDDFVKDESPNFFNEINLKEFSNEWKNVTPIKNDFTVKLPDYYHIKNNTKATSLYGHVEVEAYDNKSNSYFLVKRASLYDNSFIEEDEFELKRLIDKFCAELDIDSVHNKEILKNKKYPSAIGYTKTSDGKEMHIKVIIKGTFYYLLASVTDNKEANKTFFNSFKLNNLNYTFDFEEKTDSTLNFKVNSNFLYPSPYSQMESNAYEQRRNKNNKEDKSYLKKTEKETYYSENFERVEVQYVKFHRYKFYENIDSLWNSKINFIKNDYKVILKEKATTKTGNLYTLKAVFTDTNSNRSLVRKYFLNKGTLYTLKANLDTTSKPSKFINEFFNTFSPIDDNESISVLDNKSQLFFDAIYGTDSTEKERALKSVSDYVVFKDKDAIKMMNTIKCYSFPAKHIEAKSQLISDLGKLNNNKILPFLTDYYTKAEDTAMFQISILKAIAKQKNKKATKNLLALLEKDIPLSSSKWEINAIFSPYTWDTLSLSKELFPKILDYTFVSDYKTPIYSLLVKAIDSSVLKTKKLKKHYKQILREAKIELKKQISFEQKEKARESKNSYYYSSYKNRGNTDLVDYATMLIPFYKKKNVQEFFLKLKKVEDYEVQTNIACKLTSKNISVEPTLWNHLGKNIINNSYLYKKLKKINRTDLFPSKYKDQQTIAKSILYKRSFNFEKDSVSFLKKIEVKTKNKNGFVYFFKSKKDNDDKWEIDYIGLQPLNKNEVSIDDSFLKKGIKIQKGKDINKIIDEQIKQIEITGHKRADESQNGSYGLYGY